MDILFWIQSNPKIKIDYTTKKYFGKYLYKLVVYAPGGRLVDDTGELSEALEHRRHINRHISQSWWHARSNRELENANVEFLTVLRDIRHDKSIDIKLRVEEPRIQIYAKSNEDLIALYDSHLKPFNDLIESYASPANEQSANLLNSGAIIRKTDIGYSHKVILRDGKYSPEIKRKILNYLETLGDETVRLPKSCYQMLAKSTSFVWNLYFYTNDPAITTFISLIEPRLVSNIHKIVVEH